MHDRDLLGGNSACKQPQNLGRDELGLSPLAPRLQQLDRAPRVDSLVLSLVLLGLGQ